MITKRQLGIGLISIGLVAALLILGVDLVGAGAFQGVGPAQKLALLGAAAVVVVGITLLPLGDRPA